MKKQTIFDEFFYGNGKRFKQKRHIKPHLLEELISSTSYLHPDISHVIRCKYILEGFIEKRLCPVCNDIIDERIGETRLIRFCSNKCSRIFMLDSDIISNKKRESTSKRAKTTQEFIIEAEKVHGDLYDYSKVEYKNIHTPVSVICKKHGLFYPSPANHIHNKTICPQCGNDKKKETNIKKFGVENPFKSKEIQIKIKETNLKKYGCENPSQNKDIQIKKQETTFENHGVPHHFQNKDIHKKTVIKSAKTKKDNHYIKINQIIPDDIIFLYNEKKYSIRKIARMMHVATSEIYSIFDELNINFKKYQSQAEYEIIDFINSRYNELVVHSNRKIISPYELDIYIPEKKIAFEYNGSYWHSYSEKESPEQRNYHKNKTDLCNNKDIQLIHILENDWRDNKDITKSVILSKLNIFDIKIGARQTVIKEVPPQEAKIFLEDNHLQGNTQASIRYGLYFKNDLISLMTFGKSRFNKNVEWELIRFCSKLNHQIYGAGSKLLSHFRKKYDGSIISYSNNDYSNGNMYEKLGFLESTPTKISYSYVKGNKIYNRMNFQKHKLKDKLDLFDPNLTEAENMFNNGYRRIWDSGKRSWVLN